MGEIHVKDSIIIERKAVDIYRFWRHLENLPLFINHLDSVEDTGGGHSRWTIKTPMGLIKWNSEIVEDKPGEKICWRSTTDSKLENRGALVLKDKGDGLTQATIELFYKPPGKYDSFLEDHMLEIITDEQMKEDLRNLKHAMEAAAS